MFYHLKGLQMPEGISVIESRASDGTVISGSFIYFVAKGYEVEFGELDGVTVTGSKPSDKGKGVSYFAISNEHISATMKVAYANLKNIKTRKL